MFVVPFFAEQPVTCCVHVEILLINSEVVSIYLQMNKKCSASQNTGFWCTKRSNILISQYLHKFSQSLAINVWQQVGTTLARSIMACTTLSPSQSPIEPPTWTKSSTTMPVLSLHLLQPAFPYIWEQSAECGLDKVGRGHLLVYAMVELFLPFIVVITCILGLKNSLTLKWSLLDSLTLEMNFVLVWKALQGLV